MALKDWKRTGKGAFKRNIVDKYGIKPGLRISNYKDGGWFVISFIPKSLRKRFKEVDVDFKTKAAAFKFAKAYMRKY